MTYKKKSNLINKTGYTPGYATEKNPVNYIPSEDITMANTPYPVYATPLDQNGNPIGKGLVMQPGGEYKFKGASYVKETKFFQKGGEGKIAPSLEKQLLNKYVMPSTKKAMLRAREQGITTGGHNGGLDAIRHSSSAAATSSILPSWSNFIPGIAPLNIAATNIAGIVHEANSPNDWEEHASDLYNNFVGSVVGTLPITEENKHDLLIRAQKNGILSDMGNKKPLKNKQTPPSNNKQNNMNNTTTSIFNRNVRRNTSFTQKSPENIQSFGHGGEKNDWISAKISKLVKEEGYPQNQAVAIAYEMYDNMHRNGGYQLPMYQVAGTANIDPNKPTPEAIAAYEEQQKKAQGLGIAITDSALGDETSGMTNPELMPTSAQLSYNKMQNTATNNYDANGNAKNTGNPLDIKGEEPFQFFNPYSGFDIPTAASTLGSSIESGDTLGTVASGLKLATGLARNVFGGMGQERRKNYVTKQGYEKQREAMTGEGREIAMGRFGGYYQEGGEEGMEQPQGGDMQQQVAQALQQGASPEEVMQQLVQMGMPEDEAMALIQGIMQQMQPSTPQLKRGGMMYYQVGGEEEYGYEDEEENYMINKPSLMGKQQDFSQRALAINPAIESAVESTYSTEEEEEEETPSYDKNSARDTWVAKTGMPWSEAKKLGYTSGSAKDNTKLLSELNDPRFKKENLRNKPLSPAKKTEKTYTQEDLWGKAPVNPLQDYLDNFGKGKQASVKPQESVKKVSKPGYVDPYKGLYEDAEGNVRNAKGQISDLQGRPQNFLQRTFVDVGVIPPMGKDGKRMKVPGYESTMEEQNAWHKARGEAKKKRGNYQEGGEYDDYNEKDYKDNDVVRHSGGNTGLTKSEVNSLAKQYKMSPQEFLNIVSYGEPGEGMSSRHELYIEGSDKYLPKNWRDTYKQNKSSTTGVRGVLNRGLDYMGVNPVFNMGGYYQDGGEQQITQQVAQAMQKGMQPQEAMAMLVESGMTEDQAIQTVQAIMGQPQQEQTPQLRKGGCYQEGGEQAQAPQQGDPTQEMMQQVAQMLQQGADPQEVLQMLVEAGVPEDQATQMVQAIMQQMQGGQPQQGTPQMRRGGGYYQEGGEEMDEQMEGENEGAEGETPNMEQIESQVEQALKQGADPQEVLQQLIQMGMPQDQAMQMIQEILQEIQGGETGMESPEEGTPQMKKGGKYMRALIGKTIKNYTYNPKTDSYTVSYE